MNKLYPKHMTEAEAGEYIRRRPATMGIWRHKRKGPAYTKAGGRILYFKRDLDAFLESSLIDPRAMPEKQKRPAKLQDAPSDGEPDFSKMKRGPNAQKVSNGATRPAPKGGRKARQGTAKSAQDR